MAAQYRINGALGRAVADALVAATISFALGVTLLACLVLIVRTVRRAVADLWRRLSTDVPAWQGMGGALGAFLVTTQCLTASRIGVAAFTVAVVAGQTLGGLLIDSTPLTPRGPIPVTPPRIAGAGLVVAAIVTLHLASPKAFTSLSGIALPVLAGFAVACQYATNGRLRDLCGNSLAVAFTNFVVGTVALAVVLTGSLLVHAPPARLPGQPWLYLGGPLGVLYVALIATAVPLLGTFVLGLTVVLGQVAAATVLSLVAPGTDTAGVVATVTATILAVLAVTVAGRSRDAARARRVLHRR